MNFLLDIYNSTDTPYNFSLTIPSYVKRNYQFNNSNNIKIITTELDIKIKYSNKKEINEWIITKTLLEIKKIIEDFFQFSYMKYNILNVEKLDLDKPQEKELLEKLLTSIFNQKENLNNFFLMNEFGISEFFKTKDKLEADCSNTQSTFNNCLDNIDNNAEVYFPQRVFRYNITNQEVINKFRNNNHNNSQDKALLNKTIHCTDVCYKENIILISVQYINKISKTSITSMTNISEKNVNGIPDINDITNISEVKKLSSSFFSNIKSIITKPIDMLSNSLSISNTGNSNNQSYNENNNKTPYTSELFLFGIDNSQSLNPILNKTVQHRIKTMKLTHYLKDIYILLGCELGYIYIYKLFFNSKSNILELELKDHFNVNALNREKNKDILELELNHLNGYLYSCCYNSNSIVVSETNYQSVIATIPLSRYNVKFIKMFLDKSLIAVVDEDNTFWLLYIEDSFKLRILSSIRNRFGSGIEEKTKLGKSGVYGKDSIKGYGISDTTIAFSTAITDVCYFDVLIEKRLVFISNTKLEIFVLEIDDCMEHISNIRNKNNNNNDNNTSNDNNKDFGVREIKYMVLDYPLSLGAVVSHIHYSYNSSKPALIVSLNNHETLVYFYDNISTPNILLDFKYTGGTIISTNSYIKNNNIYNEEDKDLSKETKVLLTVTDDCCISFISLPDTTFTDKLEQLENLNNSNITNTPLFNKLSKEETHHISSFFNIIRNNISEEEATTNKDSNINSTNTIDTDENIFFSKLSKINTNVEANKENVRNNDKDDFDIIDKDQIIKEVYDSNFNRDAKITHINYEDNQNNLIKDSYYDNLENDPNYYLNNNKDNKNNDNGNKNSENKETMSAIELTSFESCEDLIGWDYDEQLNVRKKELRNKIYKDYDDLAMFYY